MAIPNDTTSLRLDDGNRNGVCCRSEIDSRQDWGLDVLCVAQEMIAPPPMFSSVGTVRLSFIFMVHHSSCLTTGGHAIVEAYTLPNRQAASVGQSVGLSMACLPVAGGGGYS